MIYNAINLEDYHCNQKDAKTNCEIVFIEARSIAKAMVHLKTFHPGKSFAIISSKTLNKNIVYNENQKALF